MATDVSGFDRVSLRDYIDGMQVQRDQGLVAHEERHTREHNYHQAAHDMETVAIDKLAALVSQQRLEDAATVDRALTAVERAAQIHAIAHEQQHTAHQEIHDIEKDAINKASAQMDQRLIVMNAFRDQLREQTASFIGVEVFNARMLAVERERDEYQNRLLEVTTRITSVEVGLATKAQSGDTTGRYALAVVGFAITFVVTAVVIFANVLMSQ